MAGVVFVAVLAAAAMHATWNALAKLVPDHRVSAGLLALTGLVAGAVGAVVLPPPDPAAWPYLAASALLHTVYFLALVYAYRIGDFGQVYPLARGLPPPLVTALSWAVLGEQLSPGRVAGIAVVSVGLIALVFTGDRGASGGGIGLAVATGVVITAYTLVDGVGVRQSGHPVSYAMWLFLLHGWLVLAVCRLGYGHGYARAMWRSAGLGLLAGALALVAYVVVLWAQTRAPLAVVSAVRETSLLFAGVLGALVFRERVRLLRAAATVAAVAGIVLLQVG